MITSTMESSEAPIGYLVPLKDTLEDWELTERIPIFHGSNIIGRDSVSGEPDKRLSRKHLILTASADGSAVVSVEGTNPLVINSRQVRTNLSAGQTASISDGDILELIPRHFFFKFQTSVSPDCLDSCRGAKRTCNDEAPAIESDCNTDKKLRLHAEVEENQKREAEHDKSTGIESFNIPDDKVPLAFRLLRVRGIPGWANTSCVSITDVVQGDILVAILSNYMVDTNWLLSACPALQNVPHVMVVHGEDGISLEAMKRNKPSKWILHKPPLPIPFGTHHSKAMILVYSRGVRVIIHTANLIHVDWNNKSQGLWMQDFPWKDEAIPSQESDFENDLIDYLKALKWPRFPAKIPEKGEVNVTPIFFKKFDFTNAAVRLIASVPGYHNGTNLNKWGHLKLKSVLKECTFDKDFIGAPLVYQFSSLGSLDEKWMSEFATSLSSGKTNDNVPLGIGVPQIIWPTVEDVRCSLEGYAAGNAIPSPLKNVERSFLQKYWAKWKATHTGRCRAMPHIKTFCRYNGQKLAWFLLTSSNLSKAAWGTLQKNNSQLMIRSYELGVLFLPSSNSFGSPFSCTVCPTSKGNTELDADPHKRMNLVTLQWDGAASPSCEYTRLPLPYQIPPKGYASQDVPWSWDRSYTTKDVHGQVWPRLVQLYEFQAP